MSAPRITFVADLTADGDLSAIPIAFDPRAVFGRARPPVIVAINGHEYRSTIAIMSGKTFVPLRQSHRIAARIDRPGAFEVTLTLDTAARTVEPPAALAEALESAGAHAGWEALSYTERREHAEGIESAKRPETRAKRIAAAVAAARSRAG